MIRFFMNSKRTSNNNNNNKKKVISIIMSNAINQIERNIAEDDIELERLGDIRHLYKIEKKKDKSH